MTGGVVGLQRTGAEGGAGGRCREVEVSYMRLGGFPDRWLGEREGPRGGPGRTGEEAPRTGSEEGVGGSESEVEGRWDDGTYTPTDPVERGEVKFPGRETEDVRRVCRYLNGPTGVPVPETDPRVVTLVPDRGPSSRSSRRWNLTYGRSPTWCRPGTLPKVVLRQDWFGGGVC